MDPANIGQLLEKEFCYIETQMNNGEWQKLIDDPMEKSDAEKHMDEYVRPYAKEFNLLESRIRMRPITEEEVKMYYITLFPDAMRRYLLSKTTGELKAISEGIL